MMNDDLLEAIKDSICQELKTAADKEIEKLVENFRCELVKHRATIIGSLINRIEIEIAKQPAVGIGVVQINIRGVDNGKN